LASRVGWCCRVVLVDQGNAGHRSCSGGFLDEPVSAHHPSGAACGPSISPSGQTPTLTVDETVLATDATGSFTSAFTSSFGADGAGTLTYGLSVVAGPSGLVDTATNEAVTLSLVSGHVEGRTATTNLLVFRVDVDGSGNVTLDQQRAVVHTPDTGPNQSTTLSADNLVQLTATITDKDGDSASAVLNIGQNLVFLDDAPSITANATTPTLTVDETTLAVNAGPTNFANSFTSSFGRGRMRSTSGPRASMRMFVPTASSTSTLSTFDNSHDRATNA